MYRATFILAFAGLVSVSLWVGAAWAAAPEVPVVSVVLPVHAGEAVFEGVLNPKGTPSEGGTYQFVYRPSNKNQCEGSGELKSPEPAGLGLDGEGEVLQPQSVAGLTPGTEYAVCLVAENLSGKAVSAAVSFTTAITPETPVGLEANPLAATTATLKGTLNPANAGSPGSYVFLYEHSSSECASESQTTPTAATGAKEESAQAEITGLSPHTEYTFCLQATNEAGETTISAPVTLTTLAALPRIEEESVTEVADTSATLHATINPQGAPTSYRFEYAPSGGAFKVFPDSEGTGSAGEGDAGVPVEAHVQQGLEPGVSYQFRVTAESQVSKEAGHPVEGEPTDFSTQQAPGSFTLPDGRAYELVSPPQKQGSYLNDRGGISEAAEDGSAVTYEAKVPTEAGPEGFANAVQVLSRRGPSGWQTKDLTYPVLSATGPLPSVAAGAEYRFFSEELTQAAFQPVGPLAACVTAEGAAQHCLSPAASEPTAFSEALTSGLFSPLVSGCPGGGDPCTASVEEQANVPPGTSFGARQEGVALECTPEDYCGPFFVAATPDLRHIVLESDSALTGGEDAVGGLYEWSAGKLSFIGIEPAEKSDEHGKDAAHGPHGISRDGSRVILNGTSEGYTGLLLRDTATDETLKLNEGLSEATFQAANAEDSRVFFSAGGELYVYETTSAPGTPLAGRATDLTEGQGISGLVFGASEDGSYVYFVSPGVLAGSGATADGNNLYVDHYDGSTWKPTFIAALSSGDSGDWTPINGVLQRQPTRVPPSGEYVAFMSEAPLTGYDNRDATSGHPVAEVYLYHVTGSGAASLNCASCDPTGARPNGVEYGQLERHAVAASRFAWPGTALVAAILPGWRSTFEGEVPESYQPRYLSSSGRLFFDTVDSLVPQDTDGTMDVYEYEPEGVPAGPQACSEARVSGSEVFKQSHKFDRAGHEGEEGVGCVALISSGSSSEESGFLDASENGSDVFFLTAAKLVPQDRDTAYDVYDAHECTSGDPCLSSPVEPPPCETEASCKPTPSPQPLIYGVAPSETFVGPGNVSSEPPAQLSKGKPRALTRAQRLAQALRSCRKIKRRVTRVGCERHARQRYGAAKTPRRARRSRGGRR